MRNKQQFTKEEKAAFVINNARMKGDKEFNKKEKDKENHIKRCLIIIECGAMIGALFIIDFVWEFKWLNDVNVWTTHIVVPILIFNFLNSIWMVIENRLRRVKVWVRLLFYFASLFVTFFVSASLRVELYKTDIFSIMLCAFFGTLSILLFLGNLYLNKKIANANTQYQIAILKEIIDDIDEADKTKADKTQKRNNQL